MANFIFSSELLSTTLFLPVFTGKPKVEPGRKPLKTLHSTNGRLL